MSCCQSPSAWVIAAPWPFFAGDFYGQRRRVSCGGGWRGVARIGSGCARWPNLVTKVSLVMVEVGSVIAHYRLHETTRAAYALEKLAEGGEFEQVGNDAMPKYYRDLFDSAETELEDVACAGLAGALPDGPRSDKCGAGFGLGLLAELAPVEIGVAADRGPLCRLVGAFVADGGMSQSRRAGAFESSPRAETHVRNMQLYAALGAALFFLTKAPAQRQ